MKIPIWLLPTFLAFGPLYIVIAPSRTQAMIGAIMLGTGAITLFLRMMSIEKELASLRSRSQ